MEKIFCMANFSCSVKVYSFDEGCCIDFFFISVKHTLDINSERFHLVLHLKDLKSFFPIFLKNFCVTFYIYICNDTHICVRYEILWNFVFLSSEAELLQHCLLNTSFCFY